MHNDSLIYDLINDLPLNLILHTYAAAVMKVLDCQHDNLKTDFKRYCPLLWELLLAILKPEIEQKPTISMSVQNQEVSKGEQNAFFIMNHILKLRGGKKLVARAALTGVYLDTQGTY